MVRASRARSARAFDSARAGHLVDRSAVGRTRLSDRVGLFARDIVGSGKYRASGGGSDARVNVSGKTRLAECDCEVTAIEFTFNKRQLKRY